MHCTDIVGGARAKPWNPFEVDAMVSYVAYDCCDWQ
jgi:hypothetical protein